jgi:hypothetical protein
MPTVSLDLLDAAELAEMLQFINDWLAGDHDHLNASLHRFVADPHPSSYDLDHLRHGPATLRLPPRRRRRSLPLPAHCIVSPNDQHTNNANRTHRKRLTRPVNPTRERQ